MTLSSHMAAVCLPLLLLPLAAAAAPHKHHPKADAAAATASATSQPAAASAPALGPGGVPYAPEVDARAYVLIDYASGQALAQRDADARMEPASLTKLMTCYLVFHALKAGTLKLSDQVTISEHAWKAEGSRTFVQVGSQVPAEVLIKGMIVQSGNDATIALAERVGGTKRLRAAHERLRQAPGDGEYPLRRQQRPAIGHSLHHRARHGAAGECAGARLSRVLSVVFDPRIRLEHIRQENRNGLLERDASVDGMKTGHTDSAGFCLVTSAKRQDMRLIAVVLGSGSIKGRESASAALINYGFTFYQASPSNPVAPPCSSRASTRPPTSLQRRARERHQHRRAARQAGNITTTATAQRRLVAPLATSTVVGELQVAVNASRSLPCRLPLADVPVVGFGAG